MRITGHLVPAAAAFIVAAAALTGCGSRPDGKYAYMYGNSGLGEKYQRDIDKGVKAGAKECKSSYFVKFDGDEFEIQMPDAANSRRNYSGTFEEEDGKIKFDYEKYTFRNSTKSTTVKVGRKADSKSDEAVIENLKALSKKGKFISSPVPAINSMDKLTEYYFLPYIMSHFNTYGNDTLYKKDDFLCVKTYGFELDGKYHHGRYFVINYDYIDTIKDDPLSNYNQYDDRDMKKSTLEYAEDVLKSAYNCKKTETTIKFSDGKWKWYNDKGKLINKGKYQESDDYKGLIEMYLTDNSEHYVKKIFENMPPLTFYIADDKIYYPVFVKSDK